MMSREGELLGEPRWTWVSRWQEEPWVIVCENGAWGFANAYGSIVLPVQYEEAERFWGALAWVKFDASTQGYISRDGTVVYAWSNEE